MNGPEELISAFNSFKSALKFNDTKKLDELISDDYKGFSLNGTVERKEDILSGFQPGGVVLSEYSVQDVEFEQTDNIGIITGKGTIAGSFNEFDFSHKVLFTDIFRLSGGKWKYYKSQVTEIRSGVG